MKKLCVSLMALVSLLCVSCSNDPEIPEKNDNGIDVTLSITTNPLTKVLDDNQVGATAPIDVNKEFIVYFMDEFGNTVTAYKLTDTQIGNIKTTGVKFTNLDPSVKSVYVVANVPTSITAPGTLPSTDPGITLTDINGAIMNISDQQAANAASVVLANTGKTVKTSFTSVAAASNGNAQFTVAVELTPIVSRIQIKKVSADGTTIASFKLLGIYIDNFYPQMTIGGAFTPLTIQHATDKATFDAAQAPYTTTNLYDEDKTAGLLQNPFGATPSQVFGYQIFPTTSTAHENVPYIILKISDIVTGTAPTRTIIPTGIYYVAVKAYKNTGASTSVTTFSPGFIYTIDDIPVSENNIVTDPTKSLINVTVNVTVKAWGSIVLDPDFGY